MELGRVHFAVSMKAHFLGGRIWPCLWEPCSRRLLGRPRLSVLMKGVIRGKLSHFRAHPFHRTYVGSFSAASSGIFLEHDSEQHVHKELEV